MSIYEQSLLTLYDMDLLFTRSTLAEDVKPADDDS